MYVKLGTRTICLDTVKLFYEKNLKQSDIYR